MLRGKKPTLQVLDDIMPEKGSYSEYPLGLVQIPTAGKAAFLGKPDIVDRGRLIKIQEFVIDFILLLLCRPGDNTDDLPRNGDSIEELHNGKLSITPGDALLSFINLYGYDTIDEQTTSSLKKLIAKSWFNEQLKIRTSG